MLLRRLTLRLSKLFLLTLLFIIPTWIGSVILYLSLPSPVPKDTSITTRLQQGKTTLRVYDVDTFWPWTDTHASVSEARSSRRWNFIMEFKYFQELGILSFGGGSDPLDNFYGVTNPPVPYYNVSLESENTVSISDPIKLSIPVADNDGIAPPWIARADGALLFWWANHESVQMSFRIRQVPSERLIEIWPDSSFWYEKEVSSDSQPNLRPLLSVRLEPLSFTFPTLPSSSSPSVLYPVRLGLLLFLLPTGAIGLLISSVLPAIFTGILELCRVLLNIIALGIFCAAGYGVYWWIKNERPRMALSVTDIQEGINRTLDSARARGESLQAEEQVDDIEAQAKSADVTVPKDTKEG